MAGLARGAASLQRKLSLDCSDARSAPIDTSPVTPTIVAAGGWFDSGGVSNLQDVLALKQRPSASSARNVQPGSQPSTL